MQTLGGYFQKRLKQRRNSIATPPPYYPSITDFYRNSFLILKTYAYFCTNQLKRPIMTTSQMNAEILRNLGILAENEDMLARVAKYLRKLVKEQQEADPTLMSKEEYFEKLDKAEQSIAEGKGKTFTHPDEMNAWLNAL